MGIAEADLNYVRDLVYRRAAIVLEGDKEYLVETRLEALADEEGIASVGALIAGLRSGAQGRLLTRVVEAMATHETSFFRDAHPFDALREHVLPELMAARATARALTVWCGACSTGQEPYSIAMLIRDHYPSLLGWDLRIVATDLSSYALDAARRATYRRNEVERGLPGASLARYFEPAGNEWRVRREVRDMVEFRQVNLVDPGRSLPTADVVFLRNVLIYFDVATKKAVLERVRRHLAPDGWLFLGGVETTMNLDDRFERVQRGRSTCFRPVGSDRCP